MDQVDLERAARLIAGSEAVMLFGHQWPDGDAIGSILQIIMDGLASQEGRGRTVSEIPAEGGRKKVDGEEPDGFAGHRVLRRERD